jgi:hypothetical protein
LERRAVLWSLDDAQLLSSAYAIEEARRNWPWIDSRLCRGSAATGDRLTVDAPQVLKLPETIRLDPKDQPTLLAAIHGRADYLLTGDASHFEHIYGKRIERACC